MSPRASFDWKAGSRFAASPKTAGPFLTRFAKSGGTASGLLEEARKMPKDHWLRRDLWVDRSDAELAESARLARARLMLRAIEIVRPGEMQPRRLTFAVQPVEQSECVYMDRVGVLANPLLRHQVVERGKRSLREFVCAYGDLPEFSAIVTAIQIHLAGGEEPGQMAA